MSTQVTLTLPDELYATARHWSALTQRDLAQTLTDALAIVLTPAHTHSGLEKPIAALPDKDILALSQVQMELGQGERLGHLLTQQREDNLSYSEQLELLALMQIYHQLWIRQSEALAEAVRRGLRGPLIA